MILQNKVNLHQQRNKLDKTHKKINRHIQEIKKIQNLRLENYNSFVSLFSELVYL